jgi:hypothetical protein
MHTGEVLATASEARKQMAADNVKVKKEGRAPKPNKEMFSKLARDAIKCALEKAASPMKGSKGN